MPGRWSILFHLVKNALDFPCSNLVHFQADNAGLDVFSHRCWSSFHLDLLVLPN